MGHGGYSQGYDVFRHKHRLKANVCERTHGIPNTEYVMLLYQDGCAILDPVIEVCEYIQHAADNKHRQ